MPPNKDISSNHFSNARPVLKDSQSVSAANYARFQDLATLDAYLITQGWTQAKLDKLTKNDKILEARRKVGSAIDSSK